jgi:RHS repeat-associated protein
LTGITHVKNGSTTVASVSYTLDDVGNRTQRVDQAGTHDYDYDDLYRLTSVTYPGPTTTSYAFDAFGNRTSMTVGAATTSYSYDDADRITAVTPPSPASAINYTWDDDGDLTARGSDSFSWDYEDRMVSATVSSVTTTFAYRGDGLRNSKTTGGNTTTFTWDVAAGLPVVLDDGNQYLYGAGLVAQKQSGSWYYYLSDGLGSTMAIVDGSGNTQNTYTYDVYGTPTKSGSLANEFDFAGQQTDGSTGLQYLRARYYDPATGTFASRDPMAGSPFWGDNPFGYAVAAPATFTDPSGLSGIDNPWGSPSEWWCWQVGLDCPYNPPNDPGPDLSGIWDEIKEGACNLRPGCIVTYVVTMPSITGEYGDLTVDMSKAARESFEARSWSVGEFYRVKRFGQHFTDRYGRDVWLVQDAKGNYQWIAQAKKGGKVWSLRKGQDDVALAQAQKEFRWKETPNPWKGPP